MSKIIFDIETAGKDFDQLDDHFKEYLLKWSKTDEEIETVKESLSFYPNTAVIVAIGMLNPDTLKGAVYYQNGGNNTDYFEEKGIKYKPCTEKEILENFWNVINKYDTFVTFNGRAFDCPFIMIRSAVHKLIPLRNLMPNRYGDEHIDLLDRLSFYGATKRKFSMDIWCRTFGITSPKSDEVSGYYVKDMFKNGQYKEIARYCAGDLFATKELLLIWEKYIRK
ncbi:MAG: ribonuclease H-like domain-containing protein [Candidatus Magnetoovum sp. WYHC-5]|nr:ribonuclease H-like domain-containing protein [Candidatus Magnetoovum sp. WYHC-5]